MHCPFLLQDSQLQIQAPMVGSLFFGDMLKNVFLHWLASKHYDSERFLITLSDILFREISFVSVTNWYGSFAGHVSESTLPRTGCQSTSVGGSGGAVNATTSSGGTYSPHQQDDFPLFGMDE
jgi:hypothetical protein